MSDADEARRNTRRALVDVAAQWGIDRGVDVRELLFRLRTASASPVAGDRLVGSRMSADHYLDLLATVYLATSGTKLLGDPPAQLLIDVHGVCRLHGRDPQQVLARVALAWGGFVPEVEEL